MGKLVGWLGTTLVEHMLEPDRSLLVGRGPSCSLRLAVTSKSVSREHCRVVPLPGGRHQLVDLGSTNGTYVNGARVATALLEPNDVVGLGDVELLFLPVHTDARAALSARADRRPRVTKATPRPPLPAESAQATARRRLLCDRLLRLTLTFNAMDVDSDEGLRGLLGTLLEEAMAFSSCQWGAVYLSDEQRPWVVVRPGGEPPVTLAIEAALEEVLRTQQSCLRPVVGGSILCMPLAGARLPVAPRGAARHEPVGALVLLAPHGLDALSGADQQLLEAVAAQTAGLVRRACLYRQATIDHLTGLSTRTSIERVLLKELRRVGVRRPLSVLLLGIDHLEAINDVHGHLTGDQVLREVARRRRRGPVGRRGAPRRPPRRVPRRGAEGGRDPRAGGAVRRDRRGARAGDRLPRGRELPRGRRLPRGARGLRRAQAPGRPVGPGPGGPPRPAATLDGPGRAPPRPLTSALAWTHRVGRLT